MFYFCPTWLLIASITLKTKNNTLRDVFSLRDKAWPREKGLITPPTLKIYFWITEGWEEGNYLTYHYSLNGMDLTVKTWGETFSQTFLLTNLSYPCVPFYWICTEPQLCSKRDVSCVYIKCEACLDFRKIQ